MAINFQTHDYYKLKFPNRAAMINEFKRVGLITAGMNEQGEAIDQLNNLARVVPPLSDENPIGLPIVVTPAELDEEGNVITPAKMSKEYHVDLIAEKGIKFNPSRLYGDKWQHSIAGWENFSQKDPNAPTEEPTEEPV